MNREERRKKRKKATQNAAVTLVVLLVALIVAVAAIVIAAKNHIKSGVQKPSNTQISTETPAEDDTIDESQQTEEQIDPLLAQAMQLTEGMTLEQKVAQVFWITPDALTGVDGATKAGDSTKAAYAQYPVGGLIYLKKNLIGPEQTKQMLANMKAFSQELTGLPIFLAVDEEGGSVARIASNSDFNVTDVGNMSQIGATGDAQNAFGAGSTIGAYLNTLGFNVDFAPVADVLAEGVDSIMKDRSFGSDSQLVADMVCEELRGLREYQVLGVIKHFPGHGSVVGDSHDGAVSTQKTLEELLSSDLIPFQQAINQGASLIMAGHIGVPAVTGDDTPSSLSYTMLTEVLRGQLGFNGVVVTDAMDMAAITERYGSADAAVLALSAGADMILMPQDFAAAYQGVLDAVNNGTLAESRLNEAVARILKVKLSM